MSALCLSLGLAALAWSSGCRHHVAQENVVPRPPAVAAPAVGVTPARVTHPRGPAYRLDNGLGSPIA